MRIWIYYLAKYVNEYIKYVLSQLLHVFNQNDMCSSYSQIAICTGHNVSLI